jgi:sulfur carrier protein
MKVFVNGTAREVQASTLAGLLTETGQTKPYIATALNGTFVPRDMRERTVLSEADRVEIVSPIEGG